ncbi:hypothetical protein Ddye_015834 [Dipteronia dyeriana]|uniref:Uncharacterized protein n=1 Tax=Dipteronia dyeriana TaxID=168575 RepID=A0AAD9WZX0_9ROSI|nr:hypothetical protein Ddye_015834 [Dipteronia dyeriana]
MLRVIIGQSLRLLMRNPKADLILHCMTAYVLNPYYFFNGPTSKFYNNEVSNGFCTFAEILYPDDPEKQNLFVNIEFGKYLGIEGPFGRPLAMKGCEKNDEFYNPSKQMYVQFNSRLMDKRKRRTDNKVYILLANDASNAQGWIVDDEIEPSSGLDDVDMRDLEDDFQSDNEAVEENVEFESDDDIVFQLDEYVVEDEALEAQS